MVRWVNRGQNAGLLFDVAELALVLGTCLSFVASASAQRIVIAPKPVGSGARALGQSAFIAVADDATAASWNPAGLIQLEAPEASIVGAWKANINHYSATEIERGTWDEWELNFLSYARPLEIGNRDLVLSINYHQEYDFGFELEYVDHSSVHRPLVQGSSEGALSVHSLACATSMPSNPGLTLGASVNWHTKSFPNCFAWRRHFRMTSDIGTTENTDTFDDFRGCNFTFGLLWDAYEKEQRLLTLGFVCHTPYTAEMDFEEQYATMDLNGRVIGWGEDTSRLRMDFPLSLGAGANYRLSDTFSVAADVEWKNWSEFEQWNLDTGKRSPPIGGGDIRRPIADTLAVRMGVECLTPPKPNKNWVRAVRGGIFYDPRPALDDPMPVYGVSVGLGWTLKKQLSLDFAYQYRWGETVDGTNLGEGLKHFRYRIEEHYFLASVIKYF